MQPEARRNAIFSRAIGDELIVYDHTSHTAHRLNQIASLVWRECDGRSTPAEIAERLGHALGRPVDEAVVALAVQRLDAAQLFSARVERAASARRITRRRLLREAGTVGAMALLIPVVSSIAAPLPVGAQSIVSPGCNVCAGPTCMGSCSNPPGGGSGRCALQQIGNRSVCCCVADVS